MSEKYTIERIASILDARVMNNDHPNQLITNFEYQSQYASGNETAYFMISKATWTRFLGRAPKLPDSSYDLNPSISPGLIISEQYIEERADIPQIIVKDCIEAMKQLAEVIRKGYKNPLIAITGSMGKSSTRLMLKQVLKDYNVQENRGNSNTRSAILLNMCKLASNPDYALFEVSINAINNRGNMSHDIKPDIAVVTGIGSAHLSTMRSTEDIAAFKARIFDGLDNKGTAIINADTLHAGILIEKASLYSGHVKTYSTVTNADYSIHTIESVKGAIIVTLLHANNQKVTYTLNAISTGMVENSLAVAAVLDALNLDLNEHLKHLSTFKAFNKVLEMKTIQTPHHTITLLDDTHNASLPAMINAIEAFNAQAEHFSGRKIIALGQISDLGIHSDKVHGDLVPVLQSSKADYIMLTDEPMRKVAVKMKHPDVTWYKEPEQLKSDLLLLADQDAFVLAKSSVTGTTFPQMVKSLPEAFKHHYYVNQYQHLYPELRKLGSGYVYIEGNDILHEHNLTNAESIEGLNPLIYYIEAMHKELPETTLLKKWPTNDDTYVTGKTYKTTELIEAMKNHPHASLIYQLADLLYENESERLMSVDSFIEKHQVSTYSAVNLTGRFRKKERQKFTLLDLVEIVRCYEDILFKTSDTFIFGSIDHHGMRRTDKGIIVFTSMKTMDKVNELVQLI